MAVVLVGCGGVGMILGRPESTRTVDPFVCEKWVNEFEMHPSPKAAQALSAKLLSSAGVHPSAMDYDSGHLSLLVEMRRPFWQRLFSPGTHSYLNVVILDSTGSFSKRWKDGMKDTFLESHSSMARSPSRSLRFGHVEVTPRKGDPSSANPLDYLNFAYRP